MRRILAAAGALALTALLALAAPQAEAATVQVQAIVVSACPATVVQTPNNGMIYIAVDTKGNVCLGNPGSGGGGSGAVTGAASSFVDGWNLTLGLTTDSPCASDVATCTEQALLKRENQRLTSILNAINAPMQTTGGTVGLVAATAGGCTPYHLSGGTAASNNSTLISTGAHTLCKMTPINTTATIYFLKIYDSSGAPTCSSATGLKHVYPIPASTTGAGFVDNEGAFGEAFTSGLGFCVTGAGADTDNSNAATGVYIEASYK